jgi:hypothetical protein
VGKISYLSPPEIEPRVFGRPVRSTVYIHLDKPTVKKLGAKQLFSGFYPGYLTTYLNCTGFIYIISNDVIENELECRMKRRWPVKEVKKVKLSLCLTI